MAFLSSDKPHSIKAVHPVEPGNATAEAPKSLHQTSTATRAWLSLKVNMLEDDIEYLNLDLQKSGITNDTKLDLSKKIELVTIKLNQKKKEIELLGEEAPNASSKQQSQKMKRRKNQQKEVKPRNSGNKENKKVSLKRGTDVKEQENGGKKAKFVIPQPRAILSPRNVNNPKPVSTPMSSENQHSDEEDVQPTRRTRTTRKLRPSENMELEEGNEKENSPTSGSDENVSVHNLRQGPPKTWSNSRPFSQSKQNVDKVPANQSPIINLSDDDDDDSDDFLPIRRIGKAKPLQKSDEEEEDIEVEEVKEYHKKNGEANNIVIHKENTFQVPTMAPSIGLSPPVLTNNRNQSSLPQITKQSIDINDFKDFPNPLQTRVLRRRKNLNYNELIAEQELDTFLKTTEEEDVDVKTFKYGHRSIQSATPRSLRSSSSITSNGEQNNDTSAHLSNSLSGTHIHNNAQNLSPKKINVNVERTIASNSTTTSDTSKNSLETLPIADKQESKSFNSSSGRRLRKRPETSYVDDISSDDDKTPPLNGKKPKEDASFPQKFGQNKNNITTHENPNLPHTSCSNQDHTSIKVKDPTSGPRLPLSESKVHTNVQNDGQTTTTHRILDTPDQDNSDIVNELKKENEFLKWQMSNIKNIFTYIEAEADERNIKWVKELMPLINRISKAKKILPVIDSYKDCIRGSSKYPRKLQELEKASWQFSEEYRSKMEKKKTHTKSAQIKKRCTFCCKDFETNGCRTTLESRATLIEHIRKLHWKDPAFLCRVCQSGFLDRLSCKQHIEAVHMLKRYNCPKCNCTFRYKKSLIAHESGGHISQEVDVFACQPSMKIIKRPQKPTDILHRPRGLGRVLQLFSFPWRHPETKKVVGISIGRTHFTDIKEVTRRLLRKMKTGLENLEKRGCSGRHKLRIGWICCVEEATSLHIYGHGDYAISSCKWQGRIHLDAIKTFAPSDAYMRFEAEAYQDLSNQLKEEFKKLNYKWKDIEYVEVEDENEYSASNGMLDNPHQYETIINNENNETFVEFKPPEEPLDHFIEIETKYKPKQITQSREPFVPEIGNIQFITNRQGQQNLIFDSYVHNQDRGHNRIESWKCSHNSQGCKGRLERRIREGVRIITPHSCTPSTIQQIKDLNKQEVYVKLRQLSSEHPALKASELVDLYHQEHFPTRQDMLSAVRNYKSKSKKKEQEPLPKPS